ncbi:Elastin microfibril interfacer [Mactra antiquata]
MALFWLIKEIFIVGLICNLSLAFSVEPKYTKFQFEEQLLEKLIRLEMYIQELEKDNKILIANAMATINTTKYEMDKERTNYIESTLEMKNVLTDNLNKTKEMKMEFEENLSKTKLEINNEFRENLSKTRSEMKIEFEDNVRTTKHEIPKELGTVVEEQTSIKDDINGLTGQIDQINAYVAERKIKDSRTIVFNAYRETPQTRSDYSPVIFDHIYQNEGNGYDASTGIFTAPVSGIYQFNSQLCAKKGGDLDYYIRVPNVDIVTGKKSYADIVTGEFRAPSDADDTKCTSFSASYHVQKNDEVSVRTYSHDLDANSKGDSLSFSGTLIKET